MVNEHIIYIGEKTVTALGNMWVALSERGLVAVEFQTDQQTFSQQVLKLVRHPLTRVVIDTQRSAPAIEQIVDYLNGKRCQFDLPIDWSVMTLFQAQVLRLTCAIPYGQTTTYGQIATWLGKPKAARAVGHAEATNPMPLVIPCHRVLGSDGRLHGYGAANGIESKAWLLELEHKG